MPVDMFIPYPASRIQDVVTHKLLILTILGMANFVLADCTWGMIVQ